MAFKDYAAGMEPTLRPLLGVNEHLLATVPIVDGTAPGDLRTPFCTILRQAPPADGCVGVAKYFAERLAGAPAPHLAITDQRLLVFNTEDVSSRRTGWQRWFSPAELVARQVHTVPRAAVLAAAQPSEGGLAITFVDGSQCVLVCTPAGLAEAMAQAIEAP